MGLARVQLLSRGAQDVYLTGTPKVSLFRTVYHRHTNFAMETIEQLFYKEPTWGSSCTAVLGTHGDLLHSTFLRVTASELVTNEPVEFFRYTNCFAHALLKRCNLKIGGQLVNTVTGEWMEVWDELSNAEIKRNGYGHSVGKLYYKDLPDDYHKSTDQITFENQMGRKRPVTFFLPIRFHMRSPELALPVASLRHQQVTMEFEFRALEELVNWKRVGDDMNSGDMPVASPDINIDLFAMYVFLDADEKKFVVNRKHEYLIEQFQHSRFDTKRDCKLHIPFKNPIKEIVWTVSLPSARTQNVHFAYGENDATERVTFCQLLLNDEPTLPKISPKYFRTVVPHTRHTRVPSRHVYCHSYAIKPEATFPTGSCNYSRYRHAHLLLQLSNDQNIVDVHAVGYNVLRIFNGYASLAYKM